METNTSHSVDARWYGETGESFTLPIGEDFIEPLMAVSPDYMDVYETLAQRYGGEERFAQGVFNMFYFAAANDRQRGREMLQHIPAWFDTIVKDPDLREFTRQQIQQ